MRNVTINTNFIGLVYKDGELKRVLTAGNYWFFRGEKVDIHSMSAPFLPSVELNVLLQHEPLAALLDILEVKDNEIALMYQDNLFKQVLTAGKFAFWKGVTTYRFEKASVASIDIPDNIDKNILEKVQLQPFVRAFRVEANEKGLLFVDGIFKGLLTPGTYCFWKNSTPVLVHKVDTRQQAFEIPGQEILTKDKAQLRINFSVQYRVADIVKAVTESRDFDKQLYVLVQLALREWVGRLSFDELMESKNEIPKQVKAACTDKAALLGVELIDCGLKDIILPGDVKEIMNQVLIAEKRAQANIIMRREETASTRSLLNTAKLMEENAMLYKLKEMEYVEKIADKINNISLSGSGQIVDQLKQIFVK
jgi:SPFH domain / Band 7 family